MPSSQNPHPRGTLEFEKARIQMALDPARHSEFDDTLDFVPTIDLRQHQPDAWLSFIYHPVLIPDTLKPLYALLPDGANTRDHATALDIVTTALCQHYTVALPWYLYPQLSPDTGRPEFILMHTDH